MTQVKDIKTDIESAIQVNNWLSWDNAGSNAVVELDRKMVDKEKYQSLHGLANITTGGKWKL